MDSQATSRSGCTGNMPSRLESISAWRFSLDRRLQREHQAIRGPRRPHHPGPETVERQLGIGPAKNYLEKKTSGGRPKTCAFCGALDRGLSHLSPAFINSCRCGRFRESAGAGSSPRPVCPAGGASAGWNTCFDPAFARVQPMTRREFPPTGRPR